MKDSKKTKQLFKILCGAAWIDGTIQSEEREYLKQMAAQHNIADDPEIKALLSEIKSVQPNQCYQWLEAYLGKNHKEADYQALLEGLSALIYSDGDVQYQEAQLLARVQNLNPAIEAEKRPLDKLLGKIQKMYRNAVKDI